MTDLPHKKDMIPEIRKIAKSVKILLMGIAQAPQDGHSMKIPNSDFFMEFHFDADTDIYVSGKTLFLPAMTAEKLNNLTFFFEKIGYPYAIEHEVCHLLDLQFMEKHDLEIANERLEKRAEYVEDYLREY